MTLRARPRDVPVGEPVPFEIQCEWCGSQHIDDDDSQQHWVHRCEFCGWTNWVRPYATVGVWRAVCRWRGYGFVPRRSRGVREFLCGVRTAWQNGGQPWPRARRERRETKRRGVQLRRARERKDLRTRAAEAKCES